VTARYTTRANPALHGDTVTVSFRLARPVADLLDAEVAKGKAGIENRSDALQDATVIWLMLEAMVDGTMPAVGTNGSTPTS
jgi:hypothetical protein